jgi:hypothetical protein
MGHLKSLDEVGSRERCLWLRVRDVDAMDRELADAGPRRSKTTHSGVAEPCVGRRA